MLSLEKRYRLLIRLVYPAAYRADHQEDMVSTLLDVSESDQLDPSIREIGGLIIGGLRTRGRIAAEREWQALFADSIRLAMLLILGPLLAENVFLVSIGGELLRHRVIPLLIAAAMLAIVRGASRVSLLLVGFLLLIDWRYLLSNWTFPGVPVFYRLDYNFMALAAVTIGLIYHAACGGSRRPWPWLAAVTAIGIPSLFIIAPPSELVANVSDVVAFHVPLSLFTLILPAITLSIFSLLGNDPRPSIAATIYVAVNLATSGPQYFGTQYFALPYLILLLGLTLFTITSSAVSARRLVHSSL